MTCPSCNMKLRAGEACLRCGPAVGSPEHRRKVFESLPPCYHCAGTGLVAGPRVAVEQAESMKRKGRVVPTIAIQQGGAKVQCPAPESTRCAACKCRRGEWMRANSVLLAPPGVEVGA